MEKKHYVSTSLWQCYLTHAALDVHYSHTLRYVNRKKLYSIPSISHTYTISYYSHT